MELLKKLKVISLNDLEIEFENNVSLSSDHDTDCCEQHYLDFSDLSIDDFEGLEFDLSNDSFFSRIEDYGIALNPINGHPIRIPGYAYNNGYYSSELTLTISVLENTIKSYDITECQAGGVDY